MDDLTERTLLYVVRQHEARLRRLLASGRANGPGLLLSELREAMAEPEDVTEGLALRAEWLQRSTRKLSRLPEADT